MLTDVLHTHSSRLTGVLQTLKLKQTWSWKPSACRMTRTKAWSRLQLNPPMSISSLVTGSRMGISVLKVMWRLLDTGTCLDRRRLRRLLVCCCFFFITRQKHTELAVAAFALVWMYDSVRVRLCICDSVSVCVEGGWLGVCVLVCVTVHLWQCVCGVCVCVCGVCACVVCVCGVCVCVSVCVCCACVPACVRSCCMRWILKTCTFKEYGSA